MTDPSPSSRLQKTFLKYQHLFVFSAPAVFVAAVLLLVSLAVVLALHALGANPWER